MAGELKEANARAGLQLVRALREGDGCIPEADTALNDSSRAVVAAMHAEHGQAWLGRINGKRESLGDAQWQWDGGLVYNFGADYVLPARDEELERLVRERYTAPYTGTKADVVRVEAIMARVRAVGGVHLVWS